MVSSDLDLLQLTEDDVPGAKLSLSVKCHSFHRLFACRGVSIYGYYQKS